ncbi:GNAT family N-acetyltransferase [Lysobacter cavernae]|uniref:GNAT family N-acetyltransferase n=1 Tax=Lysobacter cavernae TaxID=1685901 RepID=A0ABV7RMB7_9GAMM
MQIVVDPLTGPEIAALLRAHLDEMHRISPPESVHALDLDALRAPEVTFWSARDGDELLGCVALKQLGADHAEIKSMRTSARHQRRGVASALMGHLLEQAQRRGYRRLSLETGSQPEFGAARALYARFGFHACGPFAQYAADPYSVFMTRML